MNRHHAHGLRLLRGLLCGMLLCPVAHAQTSTLLLSANVSGVEGSQGSSWPTISANGRFVAFVSRAGNLVPLDSNAVHDIFLRDLMAGTITRVNVSSSGVQADNRSDTPSISADGRYVVFQSNATTLVAGKGAGIYLRDTQTSETTWVATGTSPVISADGSVIVLVANDPLLPTDTNMHPDVYAFERATGSLDLVSVASDGTVGDQPSGRGGVALNTDGSIVAFQSVAQNLVAGSNNTGGDVYVRDRNAGTTERVSLTYNGFQANKGCAAPAISGDGNLVAFESDATDLIALDTNDAYDVFLRDRTANTTVRVSLNASGGEIAKDSRHAVMSPDGRFIAFESESPDVVAVDSNNVMDIFLRDRDLGSTVRISLTNAGGQVDGASYETALSHDARYVAFTSEGTNLAPGVTGNVNNVFARGPLMETPGLLAFTTEPSGASAGVAFATQPVVEVRNMDGTIKWDYSGAVTLDIKAGTGQPGAVLAGTVTVNAAHGIATFAGLSLDKAGAGYVLTASSGALDPGESAPFDVRQTPTKVVVTTQPDGAAAGVAFTTQPQVAIRDADNNLVPWYTGTATISIKPGTGRAGATLGGTLSVPITDGVASFTNLSIYLAGSGYVLVVSATGLTAGESAPFAVAQTATKAAFSTQPSGASAGVAFTTQPVVQVLDAENNVALNYTGPVTLSLKPGTGRAGAVLSGTTTVNAVAGVATFTDLSLDLAGTGYVLVAGGGALASGESASFTVAQTPTKLAYALQPGGAAAGEAFSVQPIVLVRDAEDNLVPAYDGPITISIQAGTGRAGAVLSGTTTVNAVAGVATFTDLSLDLAGTGYVLTAASGTLASAESAPLTVAQTPTQIAFSVQPSGAVAGAAFTTQPVVQVRDAEDNVVASFTGAVTLSVKVGTGYPGAVLNGTATVNAAGGVAAFTGLSIDKPSPGYVLTAASGAFMAESASFAVAQPAYTIGDVAKSMRWACGFTATTALDLFTHDIEKSGASSDVIEMLDACRIARKVSGLEPNP